MFPYLTCVHLASWSNHDCWFCYPAQSFIIPKEKVIYCFSVHFLWGFLLFENHCCFKNIFLYTCNTALITILFDWTVFSPRQWEQSEPGTILICKQDIELIRWIQLCISAVDIITCNCTGIPSSLGAVKIIYYTQLRNTA